MSKPTDIDLRRQAIEAAAQERVETEQAIRQQLQAVMDTINTAQARFVFLGAEPQHVTMVRNVAVNYLNTVAAADAGVP